MNVWLPGLLAELRMFPTRVQINEVAQVVNKFTEVAKAADDGEGGSILKKRSLTDGASKESTVTIALPTSTDGTNIRLRISVPSV